MSLSQGGDGWFAQLTPDGMRTQAEIGNKVSCPCEVLIRTEGEVVRLWIFDEGEGRVKVPRGCSFAVGGNVGAPTLVKIDHSVVSGMNIFTSIVCSTSLVVSTFAINLIALVIPQGCEFNVIKTMGSIFDQVGGPLSSNLSQ